MVFGVQPAADLGVTAKCIDGAVVVPAPVHVAGAAFVTPYVPELRVTHRLTCLPPRRPEVPGRAGERAVAHLLVVRLPTPAGQVLVPGIEIGLGVSAAATHGVVFDESRGIERLGKTVIARDATLGLGQVPIAPIDLRFETPRLVEQHPAEDGRMVVVACDHAAQRRVVLIMADVPNWWGPPDSAAFREHDTALRGMIARDYNHPSVMPRNAVSCSRN